MKFEEWRPHRVHNLSVMARLSVGVLNRVGGWDLILVVGGGRGAGVHFK